MKKRITFKVGQKEAGRLDKIVAQRLGGAPRNWLAELFASGGVLVDGKSAKKGQRVAAGSEVEVREPPPGPEDFAPVPQTDRALEVIYRDDAIVVISKAPGVHTHPLRAGERDTAANALVGRFPDCAQASEDPREGGMAHRLDAGTSGLLVAARTKDAWLALRESFTAGRVEKAYLALVRGQTGDGESDTPLVSRGSTVKACHDADALPAHTEWTVAEAFAEHTLLRCTCRTGRMHQVRVHLADKGHPIVGDETYGAVDETLHGHFLHASDIVFPHPTSGKRLSLSAPLPPDRQTLLVSLR